MPLTLVLGAARSGKTRWAQQAAVTAATGLGVIPRMIVTAQAFDAEMAERIRLHQADRGGGWRTIEAPLHLGETIKALDAGDVAVVDCLTLWLSNQMHTDVDIGDAAAELVAAARGAAATLFLVSNEVGWGIVPENPLARRFRDEAGRLHQALAAVADSVVLLVAGLPVVVK